MKSSGVSSACLPAWSLYSDPRRWGLLAVLFLVSTSNYLDRYVISVVLESIKQEFQVSDTMLGLLSGFSFSIFYAVFGIPVARWADRGNRRTIITFALTAWSLMTMVCGLAQTFWQLALARVGVGVGESGAIPPAQSLIADYFPPERRATAIAIFTSAGTAGYLLGFGAGGYMAATYGWRSTFLLAGAPGLLLALIARFALAEPRQHLGFQQSGPAESMSQTLARLRHKKSYVYAVASFALYFLFAYGTLIFIPSFLVRVLHVPLARASMTFGGVSAAATVIGTLGSGWLADRLARHDVRWLAWLPAGACMLAIPFFLMAFATSDFRIFTPLAFVGMLLLSAHPSGYTAIHTLCGSRRRAMAIAIVFFSSTLFGGGFGPLVTGAVSDALSSAYGAEGLRYALMMMTTVLVASSLAFYRFGQAIPADLEEDRPEQDRPA